MGIFGTAAFAAFFFGALSSISLPIGALIGLWTKPSRTVISAIMSFGAGSLMAAISFELVNPAAEREDAGFLPLAIGLLMGCLIFIAMSRALDEKGAAARTRSTLFSSLKIATCLAGSGTRAVHHHARVQEKRADFFFGWCR